MFFIPWNHQPAVTGQSSTNYTVPAGKYSRVVVSYSVVAVAQTDNNANAFVASIQAYGTSPASETGTHEMWLKAGDAVTVATSIASSSPAITAAGGGVYWDADSDSSSVTISVNTSVVALFIVTGLSNFAAAFSGAGTVIYATFTGQAEYKIHYEEYNVIV